MKKVERILIYVLAIGTIICLGLYFAPIKIYLMPINAWERQIWSGPTSTNRFWQWNGELQEIRSAQISLAKIIKFLLQILPQYQYIAYPN